MGKLNFANLPEIKSDNPEEIEKYKGEFVQLNGILYYVDPSGKCLWSPCVPFEIEEGRIEPMRIIRKTVKSNSPKVVKTKLDFDYLIKLKEVFTVDEIIKLREAGLV